jgi:hypothetical protein
MQQTTNTLHTRRALSVPRGWTILGAALVSWALVVWLSTGLVQLFQLVSAAL